MTSFSVQLKVGTEMQCLVVILEVSHVVGTNEMVVFLALVTLTYSGMVKL